MKKAIYFGLFILYDEMKKAILLFGSLSILFMLLFLLQQWSLFVHGSQENEMFVVFGVLFFVLGLIMSKYFRVKGKKNRRLLNNSSLSSQEYKVLQLIANGCSNKEIADQLFIAETTVKSHVSNIFSKLEAKRRTDAVRIGKELNIL